jgi:hypothetical protein
MHRLLESEGEWWKGRGWESKGTGQRLASRHAGGSRAAHSDNGRKTEGGDNFHFLREEDDEGGMGWLGH